MGMTELMYRYAAEDDLTLSEAKERLHDNAYIRTASETLAKYCGVPEDDLKGLRRKVSDLLTGRDPSQMK